MNKPKKFRFSPNDSVTVNFTETGQKAYLQDQEDLNRWLREKDLEEREIDQEKTVKLQFWEIMSILDYKKIWRIGNPPPFSTIEVETYEEQPKAESFWILVGERLPEESGDYLASFMDSYYEMIVAEYAFFSKTNGGCWYDKNEKLLIVLAWMPIPDPYHPTNMKINEPIAGGEIPKKVFPKPAQIVWKRLDEELPTKPGWYFLFAESRNRYEYWPYEEFRIEKFKADLKGVSHWAFIQGLV